MSVSNDRFDFRDGDFYGPVTAKAEHHHHGPVPIATAALPPAPTGFTGRDDDLARLLPVLDPAAKTDLPVVICAVSGLGGIGKTSLALYAAHRAVRGGWFPGGTLFVDLRGYDDNPVTADQALLALLDALGVRGTSLPQTTAAQYALYRSLLSREREPMLLLLDNASDPGQLIPLIPGTDHHRILITSRDRLTELPARLVDLDTLSPEAAVDLISSSLRLSDEQDDRASREPDTLRELAAVCGHHPLALQIAAAMLRKRRYRPIASLVDEIRAAGDPTDALALRPIFEVSYARLPERQARLLRLLAVAPTAEVGTEAVAALADLSIDETLGLLEDLVVAHLVTPEPHAGSVRWRSHDLVRAYAATVASHDEALAEEGEAARERGLIYYREWNRAALGHLTQLSGEPASELFEDRAAALAWLDTERANLVAAALWAEDDHLAELSIDLALDLWTYLGWQRFFDDLGTTGRAAQLAAKRIGNRILEAWAYSNLGIALRETGRTQESIDALIRARDLHQTAGDPNGEAAAWSNLGAALECAGRMDEAFTAHIRARALYQTMGDLDGEATTWDNLGNALQAAALADEAITAHTRALDLFRTVGNRPGEARSWNNLGASISRTGRAKEAIKAYGRCLEISREFEDHYVAGQTLENLALAHKSAHNPTEAHTLYLQAAEAFTKAGASKEAAQAQAAARSLT
ncbi:tetratricopeptide repeat protein [Streptomyces sp. NPDC048825]|uniref:tetratricopeptide repeat protein n=1 Tax=Streptomyces sp. NPDC048825 TaxID=3365592 RepID=UPI0037181C5F